MLRRIPAVNWALARLRPSPLSGSIDVAPIAKDEPQALIVDTAEVSPGAEIDAVPLHDDAGAISAVAVMADATAVPDVASVSAPPSDIVISAAEDAGPISIADEPSAPPADALSPAIETSDAVVDSDAPPEIAADAEPVSIDDVFAALAEIGSTEAEAETPEAEAPGAETPQAETSGLVVAGERSLDMAVDTEPASADDASAPLAEVESPVAEADIPEIIVANEPSPAMAVDPEPVSADDASIPHVASERPMAEEIPEIIVASEPSPTMAVDPEPASADDVSVPLVGTERPMAEEIPEIIVASEPSPSVSVDAEPIHADDPSPTMAVVFDEVAVATSEVAARGEPAASAVPARSRTRRAPKAPTWAAEPSDRAALIRQRWADTGIKMWNPRLHGDGEAALNIQGSVGLLAPAPGETMPRYDRLEFKMLGGQIVCEGVIVEAPAQAGRRSFTLLAEPGKQDRMREPAPERLAALA
ncbi:hypothetical protein RAD15_22475 [Bradyrhizobium sp. 14AA]